MIGATLGTRPAARGQEGSAPAGRLGVAGRLALVAVLAVATAARLYGLGRESLWVDEGYTKYLASLTPAEYLDDVRSTVRNILPPLYFTLLHGWTAVAGTGEVALRLPSVVFGVLAVLALYALVSRAFGRTAGLLAAGALAVAPFQLRYSQEARMYELLTLLALVSLHLLLRVLDRGRVRHGVALTVALTVVDAAIVWTHHYGVLVLVAEAVFVALLLVGRDADRRAVVRWLASRAGVVVLVLPWALLFADQLHKVDLYPWLPPVTWSTVHGAFVGFAGSEPSLWLLVALVAVGAWRFRGLPRRLLGAHGLDAADRGYLLLWCTFVVPLAVAIGWSVLVSPVFGRKYVIASSVAFLALAVVGASSLRGRVLPVLAAVAVAAASGPQYVSFYTDVTKEQWREATAFVERGASGGDLVLFNAGYTMRNGFGAYGTRDDLDLRAYPAGSEEFAFRPTAQDLDALAGLVRGRRHAWVVYSQSNDPDFMIAETLSGLSTDGECRAFVGIDVCRYDLL